MTDSPRILELRRRVQADPASIAFAQLAEECRRAGNNDEAVAICRNGLDKNPDYLSARVTLGRALLELGELDDAKRELDIVVQGAPDNLAAIRGLAEIYQQQGKMPEALAHYRHALTLARHDADLETTVDRITQAITPAPKPADVPAVAVDELFDFDKLLAELGEPVGQPPAESQAARMASSTPLEVPDLLRPTDGSDLRADDTDEFASIERDLRALDEQREEEELAARERRALEERRLQDEQRILEEQRAREELRLREEERLEAAQLIRELEEQRERELARRRQTAVLSSLEGWLGAIVSDRDHHRHP